MNVLLAGRTPAWKRLLAPLKYLAIRHGIKPRFDWAWPGILTVMTMFIFWVLPKRPGLLADGGILQSVRDLIALLAAFFVAALAAVATFARETLDQPMEGTTPTLYGKDLTRRQFISYLFGYLSFIAFALFFCIVAAQIISPSLWVWLSPSQMWWCKAITGTLFVFMFWNMTVTTLLGIYFLIERVHLR
jgi:branched-subunit amino acid transport protein